MRQRKVKIPRDTTCGAQWLREGRLHAHSTTGEGYTSRNQRKSKLNPRQQEEGNHGDGNKGKSRRENQDPINKTNRWFLEKIKNCRSRG